MCADTHTVEELFSLLAHSRRRRIVRVLRESEPSVLTVGALARELAPSSPSETATDHEKIMTSLYHIHLPKLAAAGVVSFDSERGEVRYRPVRRIEKLLALGEAPG